MGEELELEDRSSLYMKCGEKHHTIFWKENFEKIPWKNVAQIIEIPNIGGIVIWGHNQLFAREGGRFYEC